MTTKTPLLQMFYIIGIPKGYVMAIGVIGGWVNLAFTDPLYVMTAGTGSSILVSILLAIGTIVGQGIGKIFLKEITTLWTKHKNRKRNRP